MIRKRGGFTTIETIKAHQAAWRGMEASPLRPEAPLASMNARRPRGLLLGWPVTGKQLLCNATCEQPPLRAQKLAGQRRGPRVAVYLSVDHQKGH